MANSKHLRRIEQGVESWNSWRKKKGFKRPDLSGADLSGQNLSDINLRGAILTRINLSGAKLSNADLSGSNLAQANLSDTDLTETVLSDCFLRGANLSNANLCGSDLGGEFLHDANLSGANLAKANLTNIALAGASLDRANLEEADLTQAICNGSSFIKASMGGAVLRNAILSNAILWEADLRGARIEGIRLDGADLTDAKLDMLDFSGSRCSRADFERASLVQANFSGTRMWSVSFHGADMRGATLRKSDLKWADLTKTCLHSADLSGSVLNHSLLIETNFENAILSGCSVYGIAAWGVKLDGATQKGFVITPENEPAVTVDNLEVAQFVYLLLNNRRIRDVINTVGQKAVLILGRFTAERKEIIDSLAEALRQRGYLPIVFDFEASHERDFTETIKVLAGLSLFVIADMTNPKSNPLELQATVPDYMIPFVPIIQEGENPFSMFVDLQRKYNWVLPVLEYDTKEHLLKTIDDAIITPALEKHIELLAKKAETVKVRNVQEFLPKGRV
jgi:uncharacterized protein YjbI with pentapeptide repeats